MFPCEATAKLELCFITRKKWSRKRSLHFVAEHFEAIFNAVRECKVSFAYSSCVQKGQRHPAVLVTAYRPDPGRWIEDFMERTT
uniref:Uncharacterized protein n=1 Tax=Candidatus Kentrum sp. DK TaxID=2126562 RepID=A0A450S2H2_9GAMM|nr:MAG: hypothetical protein BECKDK2373B_GA0170837_101149 [Candidatus Kentron sp. DK]